MIDDIPPCAFPASDDLHEQELVDSQQPDNSENELDQGQDIPAMTFTEYVNLCYESNDSLEAAVDLCFNGQYSKDSFRVKIDSFPIENVSVDAAINIDACNTGCTRELQLHDDTELNLFFVNNFQRNIKSNATGFLEFNANEFSDMNDGDDNNRVRVDCREITHVLFAKSQNGLYKTYLVFPELYVQQRKEGKACVMTKEIMQRFIDNYFLVAARQCLFPASFNALHVNFAASMSDGKSSSTKDNMTAKELKAVMARLQEIAAVKNEKIFENIQFITTSFGNKSSLESFFKDGLTPKGFKSPLNGPDAFFDVGFDLVYTGEEEALTPMPALNTSFKPLVQLISHQKFDSVNPEAIKTRKFNYHFSGAFGGFMLFPGPSTSKFQKVICYSDVKRVFVANSNQFYNLKDINYTSLQIAGKSSMRQLDSIEDKLDAMGDRPHCLRFEVRVKCTDFSLDFINNLKAKIISHFSQKKHVYLLKTTTYTRYVKFLISTIRAMSEEFKKKADAHSLSAIMYMSLIASSLPSSPSLFRAKSGGKREKYISTNEAMKMLLQHQMAGSDILFIPGIFDFSESRLTCAKRLKIDYLEKLFPHLKVAKPRTNENPNKTVPPSMKQYLSESGEYERKERFRFDPMLYNTGNPTTTVYANKAKDIFARLGFSNLAVMEFLVLFFEEYFIQPLPLNFVEPEYRPTIYYISKLEVEYGAEKRLVHSSDSIKYPAFKKISMDQAYTNLLPLPGFRERSDQTKMKSYIDLSSPRWSMLGARAIYLQLFLKDDIHYDELKGFRERVLALLYCYSAIVPYSGKTSPLRLQDGYYFRGLGCTKQESYRIRKRYSGARGGGPCLDNPAILKHIVNTFVYRS
ncbi:unnamed protein product [Mucor circinelloides]